jgi:hypothetical protein
MVERDSVNQFNPKMMALEIMRAEPELANGICLLSKLQQPLALHPTASSGEGFPNLAVCWAQHEHHEVPPDERHKRRRRRQGGEQLQPLSDHEHEVGLLSRLESLQPAFVNLGNEWDVYLQFKVSCTPMLEIEKG